MHARIVLTLVLVGTAALAPSQAQQFVISTYAGGPPATIPITAVNTAIGSPQGVTTDAAGNVYFISLSYGVFKLDRSGVLTRISGNGGGSSGDGGPAINAQFSFGGADDYYSGTPGVAVDSAGNVYIADSGNNRVRKISSAGIITTVAGNGTSGYSGDGGPATSAQLVYPSSLAVDSAGNLYIGSGDRVRKVSPDGKITTTTTAEVGSAIAVDRVGNLYIGDASGDLRKVNPNGVITTLAPVSLSAMTVDSAGNIYAAQGAWVWKTTSDGTFEEIAGIDPCGYSGDGGPATSAHLCATGLAVDSEGSLYVTEAANQRVRKISPAGVISTAAGNGTCCYSGDGGPARTAMLNLGVWGGGMAVDGEGSLYIADTANQRVRKIAPSGIITTVAGNGVSNYSGDGGPATSAQLSYPAGVAVDSGGNLYIADAGNHRIRKVSPLGVITTAVAQASGRALAVDKADNLYYLADGAGLSKVSPSGVITTVATGAQLNVPFAMAVDSAGNLYIAEVGYIAGAPNYRVRKISPNGNITVVAGDGTVGFSGDGGPAAIARMSGPVGLAVDSAGNLYIADSFNARIRMVSPSGIIATVAGNGASGYSGDGGPAISAQFGLLSALAIDSTGNLYASDQYSNAIRLLQPVSSATVVSGVVNAASILAGAIAPGEIVAVTGYGLGPAQLVSAAPGSDGLYATQLAGTTVLVNGMPAPVIYTSATQVAAVVPDSVSGGTAQFTVTYQGHASASFPVPVAPAAPGIFTADATGRGHAATINQNGLINTAAHGGDVITLFLTGAGHATSAVTIHGYNLPMIPMSVDVAQAGVVQIKLPIPIGQDCDTPMVVQVGNASSQAGVTIAIDICI